VALIIAILIRAIAALGVGIAPAPSATPGPLPACRASVVTVPEGQAPGCDLTPPQRLDWAMPDASAASIARCNDDGGEPIE
jgi:hypothetical protein